MSVVADRLPKKKKSWKFMKVMEFLASSTEPRSNIEECADVEDGSETSFCTSGGSTPSEPVKSTSKKRKRPDTPDFVERYLAARETRDREREERRDDDIGLFLQSLAPVIRRLPLAKQSSIKMRFHQILHEAEYGHSEVLHPQLPVQSPVSFYRAPPHPSMSVLVAPGLHCSMSAL
ncbi:hypothetical protein Q8A67_012129 [Cirrhinus molitorella]|uniref:BESS domain-containing protein n=1 Tax=Cirrhinus molitorella TaxID=172907 RepID=A0AA88PRJ8_9TELE|nr:hypothetical protein Q8A67_012129 [Cirrhinus molitorella]